MIHTPLAGSLLGLRGFPLTRVLASTLSLTWGPFAGFHGSLSVQPFAFLRTLADSVFWLVSAISSVRGVCPAPPGLPRPCSSLGAAPGVTRCHCGALLIRVPSLRSRPLTAWWPASSKQPFHLVCLGFSLSWWEASLALVTLSPRARSPGRASAIFQHDRSAFLFVSVSDSSGARRSFRRATFSSSIIHLLPEQLSLIYLCLGLLAINSVTCLS